MQPHLKPIIKNQLSKQFRTNTDIITITHRNKRTNQNLKPCSTVTQLDIISELTTQSTQRTIHKILSQQKTYRTEKLPSHKTPTRFLQNSIQIYRNLTHVESTSSTNLTNLIKKFESIHHFILLDHSLYIYQWTFRL